MAAWRHPKAGHGRWTVPLLVVLGVSIAGFVVAKAVGDHDRDVAANRRAELESVRSRALLGRARGYVAGLAAVLSAQPVADERRFSGLVLATSPTIGLPDALWVERVPAFRRRAYERRLGAPITLLSPAGTVRRAPPAATYLPATFVQTTAASVPPGVDVSRWAGLGGMLSDLRSTFAVTATRVGRLGDRYGFFVARRATYGRGPERAGFIVVFIPSGWLTLTLTDNPREVAIRLEGRPLEGQLAEHAAAARSFVTLDRRWRIEVARPSPDTLQSVLPWAGLAWPVAAALVGWLVARTVSRRRRAERDVNQIFDLSLDLLAVAGLDGHLRRVNPAFERTLGYSSEQLLARPFLEFVHPDDREGTRAAMDRLAAGQTVVDFENRYVRADGTVCWLDWSTRPVVSEQVVYAVGRDVTERRENEELLRQARLELERSRDELRTIAEEQAALRQVATLVARGVPPRVVFETVTVETRRVLHADASTLARYEPDGTMTIIAQDAPMDTLLEVGDRVTLDDGDSAARRVRDTCRPARIDSYGEVQGKLAEVRRSSGLLAAIGAPITVEGRLWGVMMTNWADPATMPPAIEDRLAQFTELIGTAIANADSRAELAASRARVVFAGDDTRRRIQRNLHETTEQRLVSLALSVRSLEARIEPEHPELATELARIAETLGDALAELQAISRGVHPAVLSRGGLVPAVKTLARRSPLPVELSIALDTRLPESVEIAAYHVVSEALTNAAKYASASHVRVEIAMDDRNLTLTVRDDGIGGADATRGGGLVGLRDRVEALGGTLTISSPPEQGTSVTMHLALDEATAPTGGHSLPSDPAGRAPRRPGS
jgi:PAS domain S-box-containing protein